MKQFANKGKFSPFYALLQLPGITISEVVIKDSQLSIVAIIKSKSGHCPHCSNKSNRVHSLYCRSLQDLSVADKQVNIKLHIRKFFCLNKRCSYKIFSQQLASGLNRYSRRTSRANQQLTQMSLEASARKSSWLSKLIRVPVSPSTCLRLVNNCVVPAHEKIRHLGIDDWAYRKGHTYGTILVDRETGKAVDLIKSREKEDIIGWLKAHPTIETVTRDRAECYSQSISFVLPDAVQITDRFHLVMNYSDYIAKIIQKLLPDLRKIKLKRTVPSGNDKEIQRLITLVQGGPNLLGAHKRELILKAKKLYQKGHSKNKVAEILNLNFRTVQKYIDHATDKICTGRNPRIDYSNYLDDLIWGYCTGEKLSLVFRKIKKKGFKGTRRGLSARFGVIYKEGKKQNSKVTFQKTKTQYLPQTISVRKLTIYLTNRNYKKILSSDEIEVLQKIKIKNPLIQELWNLSEGFRNMFERKSVALFAEWINQVMRSPFNSLKGFVKGLTKDLQAVKAAVSCNDNNGLTEGNVNRLKNIKRQMYGRASFELLRRKVVLSNTG